MNRSIMHLQKRLKIWDYRCKFVFIWLRKSPPGGILSADAAPTVRTQYIPPGCFLSRPENRISNGRNKTGTLSTTINFDLYDKRN